jgi:hypothetical protein
MWYSRERPATGTSVGPTDKSERFGARSRSPLRKEVPCPSDVGRVRVRRGLGVSGSATTLLARRPDERAGVERAVQRLTEQAANADALVDEAMAGGLDGSDRIVVSAKALRAALLSVKADLEGELTVSEVSTRQQAVRGSRELPLPWRVSSCR